MNKISSAALVLALGTGTVIASGGESQAATAASKALSVAAAQKGDPYRYGATGPNAFDCSGLTLYSYGKAGKNLPRTAQAQFNKTRRIAPSNRQKGDLVFIGTPGNIYHVGIYAGFWSGYGWMIDAPKPGRTVGAHKIKNYTAGPYSNAYYGRP